MSVSKAAPQTAYLDPMGDNAVAWDRSAGAANFECVDDAVRQPGDPGSGDWVETYYQLLIDDYDMETQAGVTSCTQIKLWVSAKKHFSEGRNIEVSIYVDGAWKAMEGIVLTTNQTWYSETWAGMWDQTDIDNLLVRIKGVSGPDGTAYVYEVYAEILYT